MFVFLHMGNKPQALGIVCKWNRDLRVLQTSRLGSAHVMILGVRDTYNRLNALLAKQDFSNLGQSYC
jgi:hypothetical protein